MTDQQLYAIIILGVLAVIFGGWDWVCRYYERQDRQYEEQCDCYGYEDGHWADCALTDIDPPDGFLFNLSKLSLRPKCTCHTIAGIGYTELHENDGDWHYFSCDLMYDKDKSYHKMRKQFGIFYPLRRVHESS